MDSKKILTIGAGAVVGYLIFCKFMKRAGAKSLEQGAPSEEGMGGGGGGGFSPLPILPVTTPPAVVVNTSPSPIVTLPNGSQIPLSNLSTSNVQSGSSPITSADTTANIGRATPPPPTTSAIATKPPVASVSPTTSVKFTDFDGNQNFQDALL